MKYQNNHNRKKQLLIGFLVGLLATIIGFYVYTQIYNQYSIKFIKVLITEEGMLSSLLTFSVLPNLLAFFVFIKRKEDYKAKGVMMATFLIAFAIFFAKFI